MTDSYTNIEGETIECDIIWLEDETKLVVGEFEEETWVDCTRYLVAPEESVWVDEDMQEVQEIY